MKDTLFALNNATKTARLSATNRSNSSPFFFPLKTQDFRRFTTFSSAIFLHVADSTTKKAADSYHISYTGGIENVSIVFSVRFVISAAIFVAIVVVVYLPRFFIAIFSCYFYFTLFARFVHEMANGMYPYEPNR